MKELQLPPDKRVLLMGGGDGLRALVRCAISLNDSPPVLGVLYDPELEADAGQFEDQSVEDLCRHAGIASLACADHDTPEVAQWLEAHAFNLAVVCSWRRIISKQFLDLFEGRVINIHNGDLPRHRGAGGLSWQVLCGESDAAIAVHLMSPSLDTGPVLFTKKRRLTDDVIYPATVMKTCHHVMVDEAMPHLLAELNARESLPLEAQDEDQATYFPMLSTPRNGLLDLSWEVDASVRFIRAFSYPYPGATVCYGDQRLMVKEASVHDRQSTMHPYLHGLITNIGNRGIDVFVGGGIVRFELVTNETGEILPPSHFRTGNRFYNDSVELVDARLFRHGHAKS